MRCGGVWCGVGLFGVGAVWCGVRCGGLEGRGAFEKVISEAAKVSYS